MKYRFYIAWLDGSEEAGQKTNIFESDDLITEYERGNENDAVATTEIEAVSEEEAYDKAYRWAFFENFTAHNTVSTIEKIN